MEIRKRKAIVTLRMTAEDLSNPQDTSDIVEDLLQVDGERKFIIDLAAVPLLSSLQIGTLVTIHLLCYENLALMKLANVSERAKVVLKLVGLDKIMETHHGKDVVAESFGDSPEKAGKSKSKSKTKAHRKKAKSSTKLKKRDSE